MSENTLIDCFIGIPSPMQNRSTMELSDEGSHIRTSYVFSPIAAAKSFIGLKSREVKEKLLQWGLVNTISSESFSFTQAFNESESSAFLLDFFNDKLVAATIQISTSKGALVSLGHSLADIKGVGFEPVPVKEISMAMFNKLLETDVLRGESGSISKCYEDRFEDVTIDDRLREMLVNEDSENAHIFEDSEKSELLFRIFKHLCIGGGVCQPEETWHQYLETTKLIYKDLIAVYKHPKTGSVTVGSCVYAVRKLDGDGVPSLFPNKSQHNFCYVAVDVKRRIVHYLYCAFIPFW